MARAARRRWLTVNGDYVFEHGGFRNDTTHVSQVVLRLRMRLGSCVLPTLGSRFFEIQQLDDSSLKLAESFGRECVADLVKSGAIRDVVVAASRTNSKLNIAMDFKDSFGRQQSVIVAPLSNT